MSATATFNILNEVAHERDNQDRKWGVQSHSEYKWLAILMEDVGEASKAVLEGISPDDGMEFYNIINYRKELIQVAAVAVAAIEDFDRKHS